MKNYGRKFFRILFIITSTFLSVILIYILSVITLSSIPYNTDYKKASDGVDIYVLSNGVHTDLVLPTVTKDMNWKTFLTEYNSKDSANWIAFGWGDKGFYLETPNWSDLKVSTACNAAFALGSTAMHVCNYQSLTESEHCKKISITTENYKKLITYVKESFRKKDSGESMCITGKHYNSHDAFYEANGSYNLFNTCNTWTNTGLKIAGAKACLWTAIDKGILWHY